MEQMNEVKQKRNYNRVNANSSRLMSMISEKGLTLKDVAKNLECSSVTARKIALNPLSMNGFERFKMAEVLSMDVHAFTSTIDNDYKSV